MFTIIGGDGKEYGPATAEQLRQWIAAGRANLETKAKALGTDEWRRLGDFAEFAAPDVPPPLGDYTAPAYSPVTAAAATPVPGPTDIEGCVRDFIARTGPLDVFACLDRSFTLWKENFLPLVGATLLIILAQMVLSFIPIVGSIAGIFLGGVFYGGLYYFYLGKLRGEPREIKDAFAGFSKAFLNLMLASLLTTILTFAIMGVLAPSFCLSIIKSTLAAQSTQIMPDMNFTPLAFGCLGVAFILVIYVSVAWSFTFALIIDRGLGPWAAMEVSRRVITRQWFRVFAVAFLGGLLALLGLIGFFIGVLFTLPLCIGAMMSAYEALCPRPVARPPEQPGV